MPVQRKAIWTLVSAILLTCCATFCAGQIGNDAKPATSPETIKQKVRSIMQVTLKQGEFTTPEGIKAYTRVPPSNETLDEVKRLGNGAIPVLASSVNSSSPREQELAMRFLAAFDGELIVDALGDFAKHSPYATDRAQAVLFLEQTPPIKALPIVEEVFKSDPDPYVKKTAAEFIAKHSEKN